MAGQIGKTTRMLKDAVTKGRKGITVRIIARTHEHRAQLYKQLQDIARDEGCEWVAGGPANGVTRQANVEIYATSHPAVREDKPGEFVVLGKHDVLFVDHAVLEGRYQRIIDEWSRWAYADS